MKKQLLFFWALILGILLSSCNNDDDLDRQQELVKMLSFSFLASNNDDLQQDVIAIIDEANKTIKATLPANTSVSFLKPTIELPQGASVLPGENFPENFTNPLVYRVFGDNFIESEYTVIVTIEDSKESEITSFSFIQDRNPDVNLSNDVLGTIDGTDITLEFSGEVNISSLLPTIEFSSGATISPEMGVKQDFTNPITYTVTAQDGVTKTEYIVKAYKDEAPKVVFTIEGQQYNALVSGQDVILELPKGTQLNALAPVIETSNGASISPSSGQTQDFSKLVMYTITRADGSTREYRFDIFEEDSPRSDRAVLVEFYKANNKLDNLNLPVEYLRNWDPNVSEIENWSGVTLNSTGRVVSFNIGAAALVTIYELPKSIGKLSMLESLTIISSKLQELPDEINDLQELAFLTLIDNRLISLPATLNNLNKLVLVDLEGNNFETIPVAALKQIRNLRSLRLKDNNLSSIPRELGELTNLGALDLRENPVTNIPKEVCDLFQNTDNLKLDEDDVCEE